MRTSRKAFLEASLAFAALSACGGDDADDSGDGESDAQSCGSSIATNHGHVLTVARSDVEAGTEKSYDITGSATHPHAVTLSAADFDRLASGEAITLASTTDGGHAHSVTVSCSSASFGRRSKIRWA